MLSDQSDANQEPQGCRNSDTVDRVAQDGGFNEPWRLTVKKEGDRRVVFSVEDCTGRTLFRDTAITRRGVDSTEKVLKRAVECVNRCVGIPTPVPVLKAGPQSG